MNDLRYALRQLRKSPGFTFVAIFTLALAIGANTSIFSIIQAVLLRPFPYPQADRLVIVMESSRNQPEISISFPDYEDWKRDNKVFEEIAISRRESYNLSGLDNRAPEQVSGAIVTANFFKVIGLTPQLGRVFSAQEDRVGGPLVAVISDKLWQRVFQRDPAILGRTLTFGNQPYTVVGVMPPQMFSPRLVDVWFPLMRRTDDKLWQDRDNHPGLIAWARLKTGVSLETAKAEMATIAARLEQLYPRSNAKIGAVITPLIENQIGEYRASLRLLFAGVGVVLLIACANLANLLSARGAARSREFAIRVAIGATRWQIVRQLLIESLVLGLVGGLLGLGIAAWGRDLLVGLSPQGVRRFQEIRLDAWVLGFTFVLAIGTSILFGLWPAWHTSRADAQSALKAGSHGSSDSPAARRSREFLIVGEVALTLILLTTAALLVKSFAKTVNLPLGFQPAGLLTARVDLPSPKYEDADRILNFETGLLEKLRTLPGVEQAALVANPPLMTGWQTSVLPEGMQDAEITLLPSAEITVVMGDYFQALKTPLLRGRLFTDSDTKTAPLVCIIDQSTADRFFAGQDPVGKRVRVADNKWRTIVGVVPHLKVYGFDESVSLAQVYFPQAQVPQSTIVIMLRTTMPVNGLEKPIREMVASLDPAQPVFEFKFMQDRVAETWSTPRLMTSLLIAFSALAVSLAVVGLYGVMAYNGQRRTREIGVRLALGARRRQVSTMMLRQGLRLLAAGLAIGFAGAFALSRFVRSLLYGVSPSDPAVYVAVTVLLSIVAALACWIPARRASRVDPMVILRAE
jgi:putative ABC transport system permease protein